MKYSQAIDLLLKLKTHCATDEQMEQVFIQVMNGLTTQLELTMGEDLGEYQAAVDKVDFLPMAELSLIEELFGEDKVQWDFWAKIIDGVLGLIIAENDHGLVAGTVPIMFDELLSIEYYERVRKEFLEDPSEIARYCYLASALSKEKVELLSKKNNLGKIIWSEFDIYG